MKDTEEIDIDKILKGEGLDYSKFYLLKETWDFGIENLKNREIDLRNGLYRKGMIKKEKN